MKVIDLLNKIANGEEVPKIIKYNDTEYEEDYAYMLYEILGEIRESHLKCALNDEVEVVEDIPKEDKKIEKLQNIINALDKQNRELGEDLLLTKDQYNKNLYKKEKIIKEAREYINEWLFEAGGNGACMNYEDIQDILDILDKENK